MSDELKEPEIQEYQEVVETPVESNATESSDDLTVNITEPITQEEIEATMWDVSEAPTE